TLSCGIVESLFAVRLDDISVFGWIVWAGVPFVTIGTLLYWMRGGEVVLTIDGVCFCFRSSIVVCPWRLFHAPGEPEWLDLSTIVMTANPSAIGDVRLHRDGIEIDYDEPIRTKQFRFRSKHTQRISNNFGYPEIALRDLYRARLNEIASLILVLSRDLGR